MKKIIVITDSDLQSIYISSEQKIHIETKASDALVRKDHIPVLF